MTRQTFSSGAYDAFGYDSRNRQTSVDHKNSSNAVLSSESYAYDDAGNLTSKTVDAVTTTYTYDDIDQLLSESRTGYSASYTYDANGNRATKTLGGSTDAYHYDDADKLTSITNGLTTVKSYGYDTAGRTTSVVVGANTTTLAYDYEGRTTTITYPSSATNTFAYNGLNTRVSKVDSAGTATYKRDGTGVTASVLSDGSAVYTPSISERRSGTTKFYGTDRLGTNSLEENASQTITATKTYDAFGLLVSSTGSSASPFGFAGKHGYQEDGDSGLKLLGNRYYDPSIGRFLTRDVEKDGRNWYSYCDNSPVSSVDPDGLNRVIIIGAPKPGENGTVDHALGGKYTRPGDVVLFAPTEAQAATAIGRPGVDELVTVGHGGKNGVALRWDKNGHVTDWINPSLVGGARKGKGKLRFIALEACCQLMGPVGEQWMKQSDYGIGYNETTDTLGRLGNFDPPWGGSGHPIKWGPGKHPKVPGIDFSKKKKNW